MGQRNVRRARFFEQHPVCCFCGGSAVATEIDHQPARALFDARIWPEGFEFPACGGCNRSSRVHENALAVLVRLRAEREDDPVRSADTKKYVRTMFNNFPDLVRPMTANEKRAFIKEAGIERPPGHALSDFKMVTVASELGSQAIETVFRKLLLALHYKHTSRVAPTDAQVSLQWLTNAYTQHEAEFKEFIAALKVRGIVRRGNIDLSDQFNYRFGLELEQEFSAFAFVFRNSLIAIGSVAGKPQE